jgi:hypothetical protein
LHLFVLLNTHSLYTRTFIDRSCLCDVIIRKDMILYSLNKIPSSFHESQRRSCDEKMLLGGKRS